MANKTIDQLTAAAAALLTHEYEIYDPAGSPKSQKITGAQLLTLIASGAISQFFIGPNGAYLQDDGTTIYLTDGGAGEDMEFNCVNDMHLFPSGNLNLDPFIDLEINGTPGVGGTFTTVDGKTVTVTKGIITSIV